MAVDSFFDAPSIRDIANDIIALSGDIVNGLHDAPFRLERTVTMESLVVTQADARREIIYANPGFLTLTGYDFTEVIGRNCNLLQGEATDRNVVAQMRVALNEFQPVRVELVNYRRDGMPFINEVSIFPVFRADGTACCFVGVQNPRCFGLKML